MSISDQLEVGFARAIPIWPRGRAERKNDFIGFRTAFEVDGSDDVSLRIAASSVYRFWVNNQFAGYGPARAPHGFFRLDEWCLDEPLKTGRNILAIEVAGYNVNSYYLLNQPAFICAEVMQDEKCLAATDFDKDDFIAYDLIERVRKVQRYSFQRPFSEIYRCDPDYGIWRREAQIDRPVVECEPCAGGHWLPRRWSYPTFEVKPFERTIATGTLTSTSPPKQPYKDYSLTNIGPTLGGFNESELDDIPSIELQNIVSFLESAPDSAIDRFALGTGEQRILDLSINRTGFIGLDVTCEQPCRLVITFDELLTDGDIDYTRADCTNIVLWDLKPGQYALETFEPYTLRYLKIAMLNGACEVADPFIREYTSPVGRNARYLGDDPVLREIFDAAIETFRQNAVDLFTDCPSRERAGWLCDSLFIARMAYDLSGSTGMETAFLENFLLPDIFEYLPEGMLPMCYPADHDNGIFIPQWPMWLVLQLDEYKQRGGSGELVAAFEDKVSRFFEYLSQFHNGDGLLENLDSWNFIEWSKANDFTKDVNYPTNMLYARTLAVAGRLYARSDWTEYSNALIHMIRKQAWDGTFFVDNAERHGDTLYLTNNRTEVCQYFAFYFDIATPDTHSQLWNTLLEMFAPGYVRRGSVAQVHPANMFVGHYLRLELLDRFGFREQLRAEIRTLFGEMAKRTGTLWEKDHPTASCNHGFASCVIQWIKQWAEVSLENKYVNQNVSTR